MSGSHLSKEFFELVKSIGESRSKQEEDKIIVNEVHTLKLKMGARDVPSRKMKEYLIRMLYVEMLGHDASFGHIHGVKMAHSRALLEKRVGYLAVSLTLHKDHTFMLLLINTIQQDLKSDNYLEASMALTVVCKLVNAETIPAVLPLVVKLLDHKEGNVKKKAVMALHRFHQIDPQTIAILGAPIRKALCDSNISVMAASLNLFLDLCATKASAYKDLVPDFVSILKQVIEHRLPRDYDYHRCPAPWVQLKLLQILAVLGASDKNASEGMYEILREVMKRADVGINVGYAIVYECVRTVTAIYPDPSLIEDAASSISRFITSDNHNLKYLGVNALASIVQIDSKYAAEHQMVVIECLEDPDETLKRKTLDLLYSMTNPQNVTVIVAKLTQYLQQATDQYLRAELVSRINQLAEKYAPNNQWFIQTMNNVFELSGNTAGSASNSMNNVALGGRANGASGGAAGSTNGSEKLLKNEMAHSILRLISEQAHELVEAYPSGEVPEGEDDIRTYAADTYVALLTAKRSKGYANTLPDILLQVSAWVLGEYGNSSSTTAPSDVLQLLVVLMERQVDAPAVTKSWILGAILKMASKLLASGQAVPQNVVDLVAKYQNSLFVDLQQRAFEFLQLVAAPRTLVAVVPPANCFDLELRMDDKLSFLDSYVETALRNGAKPYNSDPAAKAAMTASAAAAADGLYGAAHGGGGRGLKYAAYAAPEKETASAPTHHHAPSPAHGGASGGNNGLFEQYGAGAASSSAPVAASQNGSGGGDDGVRLSSNVARRWGPSGYNDPDAAPAATVAATAAVPVAAAVHHTPQPTVASMPSPQQFHASQQNRVSEEQAARDRERERKARELAAKPRELTEKEKFASSLFAGVGGAVAAAPAPRRAPVQPAAPVQQRQVVQQAPAPAPQQAAATDFLGGLMDAVPVTTPAKPAAAAASGSVDLLDLFGSPAPASAPKPAAQQQQQQQRPQQSSNDLFDIMGGGSSGAGNGHASSSAGLFDMQGMTQAQPSPTQSKPSNLMDDPFGFNSTPASSSSSSTSSAYNGGGDLFTSLGEGSTKYGQAGCSSGISAQLSGLAKLGGGAEVTLASTTSLQVSVVRAAAPDATIIALFLSNKSSAALQNIQLAFNVPQGLAVAIGGDAQAQSHVQQQHQVLTLAHLGPRSTVTFLLSLSVQSLVAFACKVPNGPPTAPAGFMLQLSEASIAFAGAAPTPIVLELPTSDLLRPAQMKTDAYGQAWKSLTDEVKAMARPTTCTTPADFMSRMSGAMSFFPVQTIGAENICAARVVLAPGAPIPPAQALVLVHGKVHSHIDLIVKSKGRELAQAVAKQLAVVLK